MVHIALLRGVNVGGKFMKMEVLRKACEDLGCSGVISYLQSGNVVFKSASSASALREKLEKKIKSVFKFEASVIFVAPHQMKKVLKGNPFLNEKGVNTAHLYVTFLNSSPSKEKLAEAKVSLEKLATRQERYVIKGDVVYLHCPKGYGKTKLNNNLIEKKLGLIATTRNWNTVAALVELSSK